ncbi:MAG: ABC-three component system middle component 2 [Candidatus Bathyarchaeia archaeon]|jgi:hypothetical protein
MEEVTGSKNFVFNSPLEIALRLIFVLNRTSRPLDLQRLIYYNYLLVHSADIPDSPKSIHADLPRRSCEMLVNRDVVKKGLMLLLLKGLIGVEYSKEDGIQYKRNDNTESFAKYFESVYSKQLKERADWLCSNFDDFDDKRLAQLIESNIGKWGSEFSVIYDELDDSDA